MSVPKLNTIYEFTFEDGDKTELTLTFSKVYQLRAKNKNLYEGYIKAVSEGVVAELDAIKVLYAAYVCAHLDDSDIMSEKDFMDKCGSDRDGVMEALMSLLHPKAIKKD